jgi:hypothetical protein
MDIPRILGLLREELAPLGAAILTLEQGRVAAGHSRGASLFV